MGIRLDFVCTIFVAVATFTGVSTTSDAGILLLFSYVNCSCELNLFDSLWLCSRSTRKHGFIKFYKRVSHPQKISNSGIVLIYLVLFST